MNKLNEFRLGWFIGLLDGEGCISINRRFHKKIVGHNEGYFYYPYIGIVNTNKDLINRIPILVYLPSANRSKSSTTIKNTILIKIWRN